MNRGVDPLLTLTFGEGGNETCYLGNGWSGDEPGGRWMLGQGSELWLENPGAGHDLILELDTGIVTDPSRTAGQRLVVGVRTQGIARIAVAQGGVLGFHVPAAMVAAPGPVRLVFVHQDFSRPMDVSGGTDDRRLSFFIRNLRLYRILPRPAAGDAPRLPLDQMIMRFESLGDNCEFGLVQRKLGAEPLGLMRFAFIELPLLLRGLRSGFAGLGDPAKTDVLVEGPDREFVIRESVYGMTYHTFQHEGQFDRETVRAQQATRLEFLRRKLLEDIAEGNKIFVIKRPEPLLPEEVLPIYTALNELGRNWLLWMSPADATHKAGKVEILLPGLLRGFVDRFAPATNAYDFSMSAWTAVCEAAWSAVGGASAE